jgi:predicted transglutaminase-like cysteine proteinase
LISLRQFTFDIRKITAQRHLWVVVLMCVIAGAYSSSNFDLLRASYVKRWGVASEPKFNAWRSLISSGAGTTDLERLKKVNEFINREVAFGNDEQVWGQANYWATPLETIGRSAGDCEDYAIAKYFSLLQVGIAPEKLRLIYVRVKTGTSDNNLIQAHMVLAYYAQPEAEPLVLDNLIGDIRLASRRPDLVPVFSFNHNGVFTGISGKGASPAAGTERLSRWADLLKRAREEGF